MGTPASHMRRNAINTPPQGTSAREGTCHSSAHAASTDLRRRLLLLHIGRPSHTMRPQILATKGLTRI